MQKTHDNEIDPTMPGIEIQRWVKHQLPNGKDIEYINALREQLSPGTFVMTKEDIHELVSDHATNLVTAHEKSGRVVVGMGILHIIPLMTHGKIGIINDVVVDEEHRQRGVAGMIDDELRAIAHEHGVKEIHLTSNPEREDGNKFWLGRGYEYVGSTNKFRLIL